MYHALCTRVRDTTYSNLWAWGREALLGVEIQADWNCQRGGNLPWNPFFNLQYTHGTFDLPSKKGTRKGQSSFCQFWSIQSCKSIPVQSAPSTCNYSTTCKVLGRPGQGALNQALNQGLHSWILFYASGDTFPGSSFWLTIRPSQFFLPVKNLDNRVREFIYPKDEPS